MSQKRKFESSDSNPSMSKPTTSSTSNKDVFQCTVCNIQFNIENNYKQHLESKNHKKNLELEEQQKRIDDKCCLFIKGFLPGTNQETILAYFKQFGDIISANFVQNFLFLDYRKQSSAEIAVKRNHYIGGRKLFVDYREYRPPPKAIRQPDEQNSHYIDQIQGIPDFEAECARLLTLIQPNSPSVYALVHTICSEILSILQRWFPHCQVYSFGSTTTGLQLNFSDLDVFVGRVGNTSSHDGEVAALRNIKRRLASSGRFGNAFVIPSAKIPILKCVHLPSTISIDINVKNMLGVCNSLLLKYYIGGHWKIKALMVILKFWAKVHKVTGQNHLLTNYSLCLMWIFYLQQRPVFYPPVEFLQKCAPNYQGGWNAAFNTPSLPLDYIDRTPSIDILKGFFEFYINFPYATNVICPFLGEALDKTVFEDLDNLPSEFSLYKRNIVEAEMEPLHVNSPVCLQDPLELNRNATKVLSATVLENFVCLCELGAQICSQNDNTLYKLLSIVPVNYKKAEVILTAEKLILVIPMRQALSYLKKNKKSDKEKEWFEILFKFVQSVLTDIFKFELDEGEDKKGSANKNKRNESQNDIHETEKEGVPTFVYSCNSNFWDNRKAMTKGNKEIGVLQKQRAITEEMVAVTRHLLNGTVFMKIRMGMELLAESPARAKLQLDKIHAYKKSFKSFGMFFAKNLPHWFEMYERELAPVK